MLYVVVVRCVSFVGHCVLLVVCCVWCVASGLRFVVCGVLCVACGMLRVGCSWLWVVSIVRRCSQCVCGLLFVAFVCLMFGDC